MKPIGAVNALYPTPTTLLGALVRGKPNFITIAHAGIADFTRITFGINKVHYTNAGIRENGAFSVCIPSEDLMVQTDYCGIMTGKNTDKASLFSVFYGKLDTAPMIRECPVCMECTLYQTVDFPEHDLFVGEIQETYVQDGVLTDGLVDISKLRPLLFDMAGKKYWSLGPERGACWSVGKQLKGKEQETREG